MHSLKEKDDLDLRLPDFNVEIKGHSKILMSEKKSKKRIEDFLRFFKISYFLCYVKKLIFRRILFFTIPPYLHGKNHFVF